MQNNNVTRLGSSFRDPAGFVFLHESTLYRQVNHCGQKAYEQFMNSGLYADLSGRGWIIRHEEVEGPVGDFEFAHRILKPERIPFISYPYEWSFGQLRSAALLTLDINLAALNYGMILKDASAYNIQFHNGKPVLIDSLSFSPYFEGQVWEGYRQFCQQFLAPLCLMSMKDIRLGVLSRSHIDGVPLDLASKLLPRSTWLKPSVLMHLHLHSMLQQTYAGSDAIAAGKKRLVSPLSRRGMIGMISGLRRLVEKLDWKPAGTEWANYYQATNYSDDAFSAKSQHVAGFLDEMRPQQVWDFGANTGHFSRLAARRGIFTVAFDIDPAAVEMNYRQVGKNKETNLLPLVMDLTNPSTALGWACQERESLIERSPVDCVMALALIHHLAISNNVSLAQMAEFFSRVCRNLIIEFVPKSDSQVRRLLSSRKDIFDNYHEFGFEMAFGNWFKIHKKLPVEGSERTLYWLGSKV